MSVICPCPCHRQGEGPCSCCLGSEYECLLRTALKDRDEARSKLETIKSKLVVGGMPRPGLICILESNYVEWDKKIRDMELQVHALSDAFRDYGQHLPSCEVLHDIKGRPCTCGFGYLTFGGTIKRVCEKEYFSERDGEYFKCGKPTPCQEHGT